MNIISASSAESTDSSIDSRALDGAILSDLIGVGLQCLPKFVR